jgi:hypothetical protein
MYLTVEILLAEDSATAMSLSALSIPVDWVEQ